MTRTSRLVVLGATGDVGRGVVEAALARGWAVTAVARREQALDELAAEFGPVVEVVAGSIDGDEAAVALAGALDLRPGTSVVNTISVPWSPQRLLSTSYDELVTYFAAMSAPICQRPVRSFPGSRTARCIWVWAGGWPISCPGAWHRSRWCRRRSATSTGGFRRRTGKR
ncbi:NAD(P)H-binding protein [Actinomadura madurae]|uniref:NAD(P)H-binding protein n=1 Tax=Actinomadura madurae TaxID=1993 RepID=UPI003556033C